jgi:putative transposase
MTRSARDPLYRCRRFPAEVITHAVWLYFQFPLSLRIVEDMLATRGIIVSHQTVRLWAEKFGRQFANDIRRRSAGRLGDKWYLDEVVITIGRKKHWLCAPSINMASSSMFWSKAAAMPGLPRVDA